MVALTERQKNIIKYLTTNNDYISIKSIANIYQVSGRTIRYDLEFINQCLAEEGFSIIKKPGLGVKIDNTPNVKERLSKVLLDLSHRVFSPEERIFMIMMYLITTNALTIEKLSAYLFVSKNTIIADLMEVENRFKLRKIILHKKNYYGISLVGDEEIIRNAFSSLYDEGIKKSLYDNTFIRKILKSPSQSITPIIAQLQARLLISYSDTAKEELEVLFLFSLTRSHQNNHIHYRKDIINKSREKKEFKELKGILGKNAEYEYLNDSDLCYLTKILLGAKIIYFIESNEISSEDQEAKQLAKKIIQDAEEGLGVDFSNDFEFINGLGMHLKVALHRLRNSLQIENLLTEQIKYRITFIYEITRKILAKYEVDIGCSIPDEEIAYIAMHIGAAFEKNDQCGFMPKILVVCGGGIATSGILSTRLKIMIPELRVLGQVSIEGLSKSLIENEVAFIISTTELKVENYEVVIVNPLLDVKDIEAIKSLAFKKFYKKQCDYLIKRYKTYRNNKVCLQDIIPEANVLLGVKEQDWREAIKISSRCLLQQKYIGRDYVERMIKAVEELGTYMVFMPGIAFAHAAPTDLVCHECISLITLTENIYFGDANKEEVKMVIVFATKDKQSNILTELVSILENDDNLAKIKAAISYEEISCLSN